MKNLILKKWVLLLAFLFVGWGAMAQIELVKEINSSSGTNGSSPQKFCTIGSITYFVATNHLGDELWKTDGTTAGTVLVKDINPGTTSSSPNYLTNLNGTLFFQANDGVNGIELWKSDGTATGTVLVKDIYSGTSSSSPYNLTNVNGTLFFTATDAANGAELWKSDGTANGTLLVKDINSNTNGSYPAYLTNINGTLFFTAADAAYGQELWKTDGTTTGTVLVRDIYTGPSGSYPAYLTNVNGTLFFQATNAANGAELWKTDGTDTGTLLVKDIISGTGGSSPNNLLNVNGILFFQATDGVKGAELWKTDGTFNGTVLVRDIYPGTNGSSPAYLTDVNGTLFFQATDGVNGVELWKTDGTFNGTLLVKDIYSGASGSNPAYLTNVNGTLFFLANDGLSGAELWKTDGTNNGTVLVKDIYSGTSSSSPNYLTNVNGTLFFSATDGVTGIELWKSDGTATGTALVKDIYSGTSSSSPKYLTNLNGTLFFQADDGVNGTELWKSDGNATGTLLVKDIYSGTSSSSPYNLTNVNGTLFFTATDAANGAELWKSDGTANGTLLVKDINSNTNGSYPAYLTNINGTLFFTAADAAYGQELWKTDGTTTGTVLVRDIYTGHSGSYPAYLTNVNGTLFFQATNAANGAELWKTDGTDTGTLLVKDIISGTGGSSPNNLLNVNGILFFQATDGAKGAELWKTDGTFNGTVLVRDIYTGTSGSYPAYLTNVNGTLFFQATDGVNGVELWKTDGTTSGTLLVKDIYSGASGSNPANLTNVNGTLFFTADDGVNGIELWKSNGTAEGTVLVKDILSGASPSNPTNFTIFNNMLYFSANDGTGTCLWKSDGTPAGTVKVDAFNTITGNLIAIGKTLYFTATNENGTELWKYKIPVPIINVKQDNTTITYGTGTYDFGPKAINSNTDFVFVIENAGTAASTLGGFTITGADANQFSFQGSNPATVANASSVTFTVRFTPTSIGAKIATLSFDNEDANKNPYNFTITGTGLLTYTISGSAGIAGATLSYTDGTAKTAIADDSGNYLFTITSGWSGTVSPGKTGYIFNPASKDYTNVTGNQSAQDYSAAGSFTWTGASSSNWNTSTNWNSNAVPSPTDNAIVPSVGIINFPVINGVPASPAVCKDLTIQAGAVLTIPAGKALTVNGTLTNNAGITGLVVQSATDASDGTGSLINGTAGVQGTVERYVSGDLWHLISPAATAGETVASFVDLANGNLVARNATNYALAPWLEATGLWDYYKVAGSNSGQFGSPAKGYQVMRTNGAGTGKGTNGGSGKLTFKGTLAAADQSVEVTKSLYGWNLIGNPYPCALDVAAFIAANTALLDPNYQFIYVSKIADVTAFGYDPNTTGLKLAPGEGFFVRTKAGGGSISFTTAMKSIVSDAFKVTIVDCPKVQLTVENGNGKFGTTVKYESGATKGLDPGKDAGLFNGTASSFSLFTRLIEDNGVDFAIQSLPDNNLKNMVVPVGLVAAKGATVTFRATVANLPAGYKVYLEDKETGTLTRLDETGSSYSVKLDVASIGTGRFYLHTTEIVASIDSELLTKFKVVPLPEQHLVRIIGNFDLPAKAMIYDMNGKLVTTSALTAQIENTISLNNVSSGVYLLKVESGKGVETAKFVWKR